MPAAPAMLDLGPAADEVRRLADGVDDDHLDDPTPSDYSVAELLDHLMGLTLAFRVAAQKGEDLAADGGPAPADSARLAPDWRNRLAAQLDELVEAWRDPAAWVGEASVGGVELPAEQVGLVALDELVIHGWDLARGTGQAFRWDAASLDAVLAFTQATAEPGREAQREGLFGTVVHVPPTAPTLDRALGYAGRDPRWAPGPAPSRGA